MTSNYNREADIRYLSKPENKERKNYNTKKSVTKNFILKTASEEDIRMVERWFNDRKKE